MPSDEAGGTAPKAKTAAMPAMANLHKLMAEIG